MAPQFEIIHVSGDILHGIRGVDGSCYVTLSSLCIGLGIDPEPEYRRIRTIFWGSWACSGTMTVQRDLADGQVEEHFCLKVDYISTWLGTLFTPLFQGRHDKLAIYRRDLDPILAAWVNHRDAPGPVEYPEHPNCGCTDTPPTQARLESIQIAGDEIFGVRGPDGACYVVVRRVCEALGIDDDAQRVKLRNSTWAGALTIKAPDLRGRPQEHFCLHVDSVPMWLATIDAGRVKPETREKLVTYQREAAAVLAKWARGETIPGRTSQSQEVPALEALDLNDAFVLAPLALKLVRTVQAQNVVIAEQKAQLAAQAPKVATHDALMEAPTCASLTLTAKRLGLAPRAFFIPKLMADGYLYAEQRGGDLVPYAKWKDAGIFKVVTVTKNNHVATQTTVTTKGLDYFRRRYCPTQAEQLALPIPESTPELPVGKDPPKNAT